MDLSQRRPIDPSLAPCLSVMLHSNFFIDGSCLRPFQGMAVSCARVSCFIPALVHLFKIDATPSLSVSANIASNFAICQGETGRYLDCSKGVSPEHRSLRLYSM